MQPTVLAPFTARDGENLAVYEWPLDAWASQTGRVAPPPRAVVLIVHGLGEHAGRYSDLAGHLLDWGFAVRAFDQRGHGESGGARGVLPGDTALLDDLAEIVDDTRRNYTGAPVDEDLETPSAGRARPLPLILLGHSLGGLVVGRFAALGVGPVQGVVLSSPAFDAGMGWFQKLLLTFMPHVAPDFCVGNGLKAAHLCRNPVVVRNYETDRLVHDRISPRLARFIARSGPATLAAAERWTVPTLLMSAGDDRIVRPGGSRAFAERAAASAAVKPGVVTAREFPGLYHEIFNEPAAAPVLQTLQSWLDARF